MSRIFILIIQQSLQQKFFLYSEAYRAYIAGPIVK